MQIGDNFKTMKIILKRYQLFRDVTVNECQWLDRDFKKGEIVFEYPLYTYGCIGNKGVACSEKDSESPFFELPKDSLKEI
jgi:hypothetical protein